jgi:hypothetical protein
MKSRMSALVLVVAAAACASSTPLPGSAPGRASLDVEAPPIAALLGERDHLALTSTQVEALESIAREWAATDYELRRERGAVRGSNPIAALVALGPGAGSLRVAVAANHRRGVHAVEQVLTPEQRRLACETRSAADGTEGRRPWPGCAGPAPVPALTTTQGGS